MHGRDGFMLHGDNSAGNHTASEGCIIQNHATRAYVRVKATEGDDRLEVIE